MIKFALKNLKESNREYVYRTLKENIINFSYLPGDIIELKKLVKFQEGILEFGSDIKEFFYLDNQFHATIFKKCGFSSIWNSIENISQDYNRFRFLDTISKINATKVIEQHSQIIEALEKKDEELFNQIISEHLRNYLSSARII